MDNKQNGHRSSNSSSLPMAVIILAAGKGTRMNNPDKAKVMFEVSGVPMIDYVVKQALALLPERVIVVVGFQKRSVVSYLEQQSPGLLEFVVQETQLGTGHAVLQTQPFLKDFQGNVVILSGDVPLLQTQTLIMLSQAHHEARAKATVLSVTAPDPTGYGRIVRKSDGEFERIVEQKDANNNERCITEINSGIYVVHAPALFSALEQVSDNNAQKEYYLTDIVTILRNQGDSVIAWKCDVFEEVHGINTPEQLEQAQEILAGIFESAL